MKQFKGTVDHGQQLSPGDEVLITVFEDGDPPAVAQIATRPNQWATWSAPIHLEEID